MSKTDKTEPYRVRLAREGVLDCFGYCRGSETHHPTYCYSLPFEAMSVAFKPEQADQEQMHRQRQVQRHKDRALVRKIVKGDADEAEALWADRRHDVYGLPSW